MELKEELPTSPEIFQESAEELYQMAPCGYVSITPDGRIIKANRTLGEWIGYQPEELTSGLRIHELLTAGSRIFYETHLLPLLRLRGNVDEIALDLKCRDGRVLATLTNSRQKRDEKGVPILNRLTIFNMAERRLYERELLAERKRAEDTATELARVNHALAKTNAELLKASEDLAEFVYAANHDLQEPLRTITAYTQMLARRYRGKLDDDADVFLGYIIEGALRMRSLIDDLLSFSRAEKSDLAARPTNLQDVLDVTLANLHSSLQESGAVVTHDALPIVEVDSTSLVHVFQNLVGNAINYRKPDTVPKVHISASRDVSGDWLIEVSDNGIGFEPQHAEQIFGLFKRLHGSDIPGTGLGLAICRKIIQSHGGRIWATSQPGIGSRFFFSLPTRPRVAEPQ